MSVHLRLAWIHWSVKNSMGSRPCVFVAHGMSRENVRLQPWRYLYELAERKSRSGPVILVTDVVDHEHEEQWSDNLRVVYTGLLSVRSRMQLVEYINGLNPVGVWWSTTPRSIVYFRAWKRLVCHVTALITCPLYPWSLLIKARVKGIPKNEINVLIQQRLVPRFLFVRFLEMECVRAIFVQSLSNKAILLKAGVSASKVSIVPVGIDPEDRQQLSTERVEDVRRAYGFPEGSVIFTYMGAVRKIRGIEVLVEAFSDAARRSGKCYLVILARGADEQTCDYLKSRFTRLGIEERVHIQGGWLSRDEVWERIDASDVVTLPFVLVPSDVPIAILEALARGKPVIGSRVDGIPELIEGRGIAVESMNEKQLADSIVQLSENPLAYRRMSDAASDFMGAYPDWERVHDIAEELEQAVG